MIFLFCNENTNEKYSKKSPTNPRKLKSVSPQRLEMGGNSIKTLSKRCLHRLSSHQSLLDLLSPTTKMSLPEHQWRFYWSPRRAQTPRNFSVIPEITGFSFLFDIAVAKNRIFWVVFEQAGI